MKTKRGWRKQLRRFFSSRRPEKQPQNNDSDIMSNKAHKTATAYPWSPEDILSELNGLTISNDNPSRGEILLIEVGGGGFDMPKQGWIIDFKCSCSDKVIVSRYDIPQSRLEGYNSNGVRSNKAPKGPPGDITYTFQLRDGKEESVELTSLSWIWYNSRKTFSQIETGKLSDMVAFVTGKIAFTGSQKAWDGIEICWNEAKERVTAKKKNQTMMQHFDIEDEMNEEEEEMIDEEAKILATYKPAKEPMDPRKIEFWKRHFGTDFLVAAYLYLISTLAYMFFALRQLFIGYESTNVTSHLIANAVASVFYTVGSIYFIKLSYPETTMLMIYHTMSTDPNSMTFIQRYFTANEMLIASWLFLAGFIIPYIFVILYELLIIHNYPMVLNDLITTILLSLLISVLNISAMPDSMRANNGRGSSWFFDNILVPLLHLNNKKNHHDDIHSGGGDNMINDDKNTRYSYWYKHFGSDGLAGLWILAIIGILGGIFVVGLVFIHPFSAFTWFTFWSTAPFTIGSLLMVRASYPENMNTSLIFQDPLGAKQEEENDGAGENSPLLV